MDGWPFWVVQMPAYGSFHLNKNVHPPIIYLVISYGRVPTDWTNLLQKTKSKYQKSVDRSVVNLEYSMEKQGSCIEAWTGNGHLKSSSQKKCYGNFVLIENLYDCNFTSKKYYIIHVDDQISEMLSLSCTAMELKICFEKVPLNFLYHLVFENNALHQTVWVIVIDELHTVEERCTATTSGNNYSIRMKQTSFMTSK